MSKLISFILITSSLIISGCSSLKNKVQEINLTIEDFNMSQFSNDGNKQYSIYSPQSIYLQKEQHYKLENTDIKFYDKNKIKYIIKSDKSSLLNSNKTIKLIGNVELFDLENEMNFITADNLFWDINNSSFMLEGNVNLTNNFVNLISSKATLNTNENIIKFFKPVKYNYNENDSNTEFNISSDNAFYDLKNKSLLFKTITERVKSKITF